MYLLVAIGWQGGEELAKIKPEDIDNIAGFTLMGFALNFVIGIVAYFGLKYITKMRQVDRATVAGYYGSDSAGTYATCVAFLGRKVCTSPSTPICRCCWPSWRFRAAWWPCTWSHGYGTVV